MKKLLAILLALVMCVSFCACGGSNSDSVELTVDNITEYINFDMSYGERESHNSIGITFTDIDVNLEIYPTVSGAFENVQITAEITCPDEWTVNSSDSAYNDADDTIMILDITLPANGEYSETHKIGRAMWNADPSAPCTLNIKSVSGTFTKQ